VIAMTNLSPRLSLQVHHGDVHSFHVNAVLVTGGTEAVLVDTGFTRADAHRIAAMVLDSGRRLTTIYVSHADPDFYFGAALLTQWFPEARLVATAPTVAAIEASVAGKLATWGPRLGANAPPQPVPIPTVLAGNAIELEGEALEVRGLDDALPGRSFVWIPSLRTIVGGVNVFAGLHAWTADSQAADERALWARKLGAMAALQPARVIAGHALPGAAEDATQLAYTRAYLERFEAELPAAANGAALVGAMQRAYPDAGLMIALEIGAMVNKGEMAW
jgi:glyoxylase-like metal-dependent hydrolase (beta-lactamase superfamily II)